MSASKVKPKSSKKDRNVDSGTAEVLVLPPKLLQKLGITLGNISLGQDDITAEENISLDGISSTSSLEQNKFNDVVPYKNTSKKTNNFTSDTSIMETANLMKESVLLSPTFTASSNINQEICNTLLNKEKVDLLETITHGKTESSFALDVEHFTTKNKSIQNEANDKIIQVVQNDADMELNEECLLHKEDTTHNENKRNNKVSVISEEIISQKTLEEWKVLEASSNSSFIPVSINSLITKDKKKYALQSIDSQQPPENHFERVDPQCNRFINNTKEVHNTIFLLNTNHYQDEDVIADKNEAIIVNNAKVTDSGVYHSKISLDCNIAQNEIPHNENSEYNFNSNTKKLPNENYVSQETENEKVTLENQQGTECTIDRNDIICPNSNLIKLSNLIERENKAMYHHEELPESQTVNGVNTQQYSDAGSRNNKENLSKNNKYGLQSKLLIQGVEKPGGPTDNSSIKMTVKNLKTYSKKSLRKTQITPEPHNEVLTNSYALSLSDKYEKKLDTTTTQSFCICDDFGRYSYYDLGRDYEHLHFLKHKDVGCSLTTLFSIYDESGISNDPADESSKEQSNIVDIGISDKTQNENICYNNYYNIVEGNLKRPIQESLDMDISISENENVVPDGLTEDDEYKCHDETGNSAFSPQDTMLKTAKPTKKSSAVSSEICNEKSLDIDDKFQIEIDIAPSNSPQDSDKNKLTTPNEKITRTKRKRIDSEESPLIQLKKKSRNARNHEGKDTSKTSLKVEKKSNELITCGVCHDNVAHNLWFEHVSKQHSYLAWKESEPAIDLKSEEVIYNHLSQILKEVGQLVCHRCGQQRDNAKKYLRHVNTCSAVPGVSFTVTQSNGVVKCAVCQKEVTDWLDHISKEHNYLAWKEGESPIDFENEETLRQYLNSVTKEIGGLVCGKCGCRRKYVKAYLDHLNICDYQAENSSASSNLKKCGVCGESVSDWFLHISEKHNYLAWVDGESPLDINDEQSVCEHLCNIIKQKGELVCSQCGRRRKHAKAYLSHAARCHGDPDATLNSTLETTLENSPSGIKCGVCNKEVDDRQKWLKHIEEEHNYIAWEYGQLSLNVDDKDAIYDHLYNISKENDGLRCTKCGFRRKYVKSYLHHIESCWGNSSLSLDNSITEKDPISKVNKNNTKCGVCEKEINDQQWLSHIEKEHNYIAWKDGEKPLDLTDNEAIYEYLYNVLKQNKRLICSKCGCRRKYVKSYLKHTKRCTGDPDCTNDSIATCSDMDASVASSSSVTDRSAARSVKCGVCGQELPARRWLKHIEDEHNYIAWKENEPLDVKDEEAIYQHLYDIIQTRGELTCKRCGCRRKYAKLFLAHLMSCCEDLLDPERNSIDKDTIDVCGVCKKEIKHKNWYTHIQRLHNYIAWKEGETPVDAEDKEKVFEHLANLSKRYNGLTCAKCNVTKKYVKSYLSHVDSCDSTVDVLALSEIEVDKDCFKCAICQETGAISNWKTHAFDKHYNVAWMVGGRPIDLKNSNAVEPYLKEYKRVKKILKCLVCGLVRASAAGFYAHVVVCGKSEEEADMFKNVCEVCNSKYIAVYRTQHMQYHREQEAGQRRKLQQAAPAPAPHHDLASGKRRAAQKAKDVMKSFTVKIEEKSDGEGEGDNNGNDDNYDAAKDGSSSESDDSLTEVSSEEMSEATEAESEASDKEKFKVKRKKKHTDSSYAMTNCKRFPTVVDNPSAYINNAAKDFRETHYTSSTLFPQWLSCEYEPVADNEVENYLPPVMESCKVMYMLEDWSTYKRFEARYIGKESCLFAGGSINAIRWVPPRREAEGEGGAAGAAGAGGAGGVCLSVHAHRAPDAPRCAADQCAARAGLVQIWNMHDFSRAPEFAFGLAHELGTVWSMEWCPSGACERPSGERMGLLALACSDGSAYIFSVPHPSTVVKNGNLLYKLKPVAELRMYRDDSLKVQCTAVSWSQQKGHSCIVVGYANGSTAFYDLSSESPLLTSVEDGVHIYYPFHDERPHSSCISDVLSMAGGSDEGRALGGVCSASVTGALAALGAPGAAPTAPAGTAHLQLSATRLARSPLWPAALLTGNSEIVSQAMNEVEWWGAARRLGALGAARGCGACALVAAFLPPLLKTMRLHPVYNDARDIQIRAKIDLVPLEKKSSKKPNDKALDMNSFTYENVIQTYGIEFKRPSQIARDQLHTHPNKPRKRFPELFPLASVTDMEFCPTPKYHKRLAIATHSGLLFVINT